MNKKITILILAALGIQLFFLVSLKFTAWPEMVAWPYLFLKGWLPYRDIAIAHTPLLLAVLALFNKFVGVGIMQLKIFTYLLIALNTIVLFFVVDKLQNRKSALFSTAIYAGLLFVFQGNGLWFDLALVPFALLVYFFLQKKKYLLSGIFFALGLLTKQTFIYFAVPVLLLILSNTKLKLRKLTGFVLGGVSVFVVFFLFLYFFGILDDFYFWAVKFGILYLPQAEGQLHLPSAKEFFFSLLPFSISLTSPNLLVWILAGLAGVYPRWELFHFQPALPFLAIAFGNFFVGKTKNVYKFAIALFLLLFLLVGLNRQIGVQTRFYEDEVKDIVGLLKSEQPKENIYVVGYWDSLYALTGTLPATKPLIPYIPWYLDYPGVKESILSDLKDDFPEKIVTTNHKDLEWEDLGDFIDRYYQCSQFSEKIEICNLNK